MIYLLDESVTLSTDAALHPEAAVTENDPSVRLATVAKRTTSLVLVTEVAPRVMSIASSIPAMSQIALPDELSSETFRVLPPHLVVELTSTPERATRGTWKVLEVYDCSTEVVISLSQTTVYATP